MERAHTLAATLAAGLLSTVSAFTQTTTSRQGSSDAMADGARRVRITVENLPRVRS